MPIMSVSGGATDLFPSDDGANHIHLGAEERLNNLTRQFPERMEASGV